MSKLSNGLYYVIEIVNGDPSFAHAFATAEQRHWWDLGYIEASDGDWCAMFPFVEDEWDSDQDELRAETERFMAAHMAEEGLTVAEPEPV